MSFMDGPFYLPCWIYITLERWVFLVSRENFHFIFLGEKSFRGEED